jgi:tetratricopeptide (TPR) repeat protein
LQEDLARQLQNQPLAFARDSSVLERVRKCQRRYPRLATAVAASLFLLLPLAAIAFRQAELAARARETQQAEAIVRATDALADLQTAAILLASRSDPTAADQGYALAMPALKTYAMTADGDWNDRPAVRKLTPELQAELHAAVAEVLILLPQVEAARGGSAPEALTAALHWNALAAQQFSNDERPAVIAWQRDEFEARARGEASPKREIPPLDARSDFDMYFYGLELSAGDRYTEALPLLTAYCDRHPGHFRAWFARGICHELLGQFADANAAFSVCLALRSELPQPHVNRGLARLKLHRYADAEADFTRALERKPGWSKALINRGLARQALGQFTAAVEDFTAVLNGDSVPTRVYFLRSRARLAAGDKAGASADKAEGLARMPADALSFAARGKWRMDAGDWSGAIADCEAAVRLNPRCRDAMLNQAIVLADNLGQNAEAIPVLDKLLTAFPGDAEALGGRGVYLARLGRATEATRDAKAVLKLDRSGFRYYQMAGLFAQLAKHDAAAATRQRALDMLDEAFRAGFNDWPTLKTDSDLDPIRGDAGFIAAVAAARRLDSLR